MKQFAGTLTVSEDGKIWFNLNENAACRLRIQGIDKKKIRHLLDNDQFIDIKIVKKTILVDVEVDAL